MELKDLAQAHGQSKYRIEETDKERIVYDAETGKELQRFPKIELPTDKKEAVNDALETAELTAEQVLQLPEKIVLADGKEYLVSPITMGVMMDLEKKFGSLNALSNLEEGEAKLSDVAFMAFVLLKQEHPELTQDRVNKLITIQNMPKLVDLINKMNNLQGLEEPVKKSSAPPISEGENA